MGLFDYLADMVENAKREAIKANKKPETPDWMQNSIKERAYQAYKNSSQDTRDAFDRSANTNFKERYDNETKK